MAVTFLATLLGRKPDDPGCREDVLESAQCGTSRRRGSEFGRWVVNLPLIRDRVPARYRPALYFETFYKVGAGAFMSLFLLSGVVLKTSSRERKGIWRCCRRCSAAAAC
jgi:hypothetical protein